MVKQDQNHSPQNRRASPGEGKAQNFKNQKNKRVIIQKPDNFDRNEGEGRSQKL